jgi:hypothetical protein
MPKTPKKVTKREQPVEKRKQRAKINTVEDDSGTGFVEFDLSTDEEGNVEDMTSDDIRDYISGESKTNVRAITDAYYRASSSASEKETHSQREKKVKVTTTTVVVMPNGEHITRKISPLVIGDATPVCNMCHHPVFLGWEYGNA